MNLKSRFLGFGAAAVLSLGMVAGAMAQDPVQGTTSVTFEDNDAPTVCTLTVVDANADFGTYTWDGSDFASGVDGGTVGIDGDMTAARTGGYLPPNDLNCKLQISGEDLDGTGDAEGQTIPVGSITVNGTTQALTASTTDVTGTPLEGTLVSLTLASIPGTPNSGEIGSYEGTVTLTTVPADS